MDELTPSFDCCFLLLPQGVRQCGIAQGAECKSGLRTGDSARGGCPRGTLCSGMRMQATAGVQQEEEVPMQVCEAVW